MKHFVFTLLIYLTLSSFSHAQESKGQIEVVGISLVKEIPEDVSISIPLTIIDSTYLNCSKRLNQLLSELQSDLKSKGLSEDFVHTNTYRIAENYEYIQGQRVKKGYKGAVNVSIRKKYEPELIDKFLQSANSLQFQYIIEFKLSEEQKDKMSDEAMVRAVEDAKSKAGVLAKASGVKINSIEKISYGKSHFRPGPLAPAVEAIKSFDSSGANSLKLSPEETSVSQSVLIVWEIVD